MVFTRFEREEQGNRPRVICALSLRGARGSCVVSGKVESSGDPAVESLSSHADLLVMCSRL
jgi:hypothetical protein